VGFRSPLTAMLDHVDADFTIYEEVGEVSIETCRQIRKALGRDYITLADLPRIPLEGMNEGDKQLIMRALRGLKPDEKLKLGRG